MKSYRLWSVLDMLKLNAEAFLRTTTILHKSASLVENNKVNPDLEMTPKNISGVIAAITELFECVKTLGAKVTELTVTDFLSGLNTGKLTFGQYAHEVGIISQTLRRELSLINVLVVDSDKSEYFNPKNPFFGAEVSDRFPSVTYDIDEAAKCFSLSRSTASVFHSLRCLEAAIRAISRCLGLPDPTKATDRNWSNILRKITEEMDTRWPKNVRLSGDGRMFEEIVGSLAAIQNPYRNSTMHLDEKYTEEEAKYIFEMVRGLMRTVASRMDEQGLPLA